MRTYRPPCSRSMAAFLFRTRSKDMYDFWKMTPGGNPTILLKAEDFPPQIRASVANAVMDSQHIGAEQVGYVRLSGTPRLDMMGGEFCLNATRSFALLLAERGLLAQEGDVLTGRVEVSGVSSDVAVRVLKQRNGLPFAEACLHFSDLPMPEDFPGGLRLVRVPGIAHILQEGPLPGEKLLPEFCERQRLLCGVAAEEAVGHMWLSSVESAAPDVAEAELRPVVWVRDTGSLCSESACGSGTLACALALHAEKGCTHCTIRQPSGHCLSVRMEKTAGGWDIWVGGPVRMTASGKTDLTGLPGGVHTL